MKTMYPAQVNSPGTELAGAIDAAQDSIQVADGSVLPDGPNLLTIGTDEAAETILYTGKTGDELTGVTRGFQGTAQSWAAGTKVARYFTAYDHDAAVSNISELSIGLKALGDAARDRLDIVVRQDVVLNAGMQILNAQRRAAFSLSGIKGRTLVNLLGRRGGCESMDSSYYQYGSVFSVDTAVKHSGSASLKLVSNTSTGAHYFRFMNTAQNYIPVVAGQNVLYGAWVKPLANSGVQLAIFFFDSGGINISHVKSEIMRGDSKFSYLKILTKAPGNAASVLLQVSILDANGNEMFTGTGSEGLNLDSAYLYTITDAEYAALGGMTPEQVAAKYPYVDSVQPVRNPYAIRYGENLLPPFYEWETTTGSIEGPYAHTITAVTSASVSAVYKMKPVVGQSYTFSIGSRGGGRLGLDFRDASGNVLATSGWVDQDSITLDAPVGSEIMQIFVSSGGQIGTFTFKNPMLSLGTEAKPFKPREDATLALQTDLYADPLTGENADELFEKDGQYFKLAKWRKRVYGEGDTFFYWGQQPIVSGRKAVFMPLPKDRDINKPPIAIKYDGRYLSYASPSDGPDAISRVNWQNTSENNLGVSIPNTDSGWGDNYVPTPDEVKAYFMGWRMGDVSNTQQYTGTGTKCWAPIVNPQNYHGSGGWIDFTTSLPTTLAPTSSGYTYTPYQLVYQLATPTVEPVVSEGMLTFNEGDNQIEVGTGIVVRESTKPYGGAITGGLVVVNYKYADVDTWLKYPLKSFVGVYRNGMLDPVWDIKPAGNAGRGLNFAQTPPDKFDPSAAYSVTYMMLDKSPIVPFSGTYAVNEKAMLQELTDAVQQNATVVSVLMNKKEDIDKPKIWIKPTLINGWVYFGNGPTVEYSKTSNGLVLLKGKIKSGVIADTIFNLPPGYRPKEDLLFAVRGFDTGNRMVAVTVGKTGVVIAYDINTEIHLDGIVFLAEQ
ncbi:hypothetical protein ACWGNU_08835 [Paenibacillus lautus]